MNIHKNPEERYEGYLIAFSESKEGRDRLAEWAWEQIGYDEDKLAEVMKCMAYPEFLAGEKASTMDRVHDERVHALMDTE